MQEIHCTKNARNLKSTFDLRWAKDQMEAASERNLSYIWEESETRRF